jgi:dTDP-glucose 4,6-dehydratase
MIKNIIDNKPLPVYGNGENIRDWVFIDDHIKAIDMIFHEGCLGETYLIGGGNKWRNIDLVKLLVEIVDRQLGRKKNASLNLISFVDDRQGHDYRYAIDFSKVKYELGWQPCEEFEQGIEKTVNWYLENKEWM